MHADGSFVVEVRKIEGTAPDFGGGRRVELVGELDR